MSLNQTRKPYHGDYIIPGQLPLWGEECLYCGTGIEADYYGVWLPTYPQAPEASPWCPARGNRHLHEPSRSGRLL